MPVTATKADPPRSQPGQARLVAACDARFRWAAGYGLLLGVVFFKPLVDWARYALATEVYSHLLLIPVLTTYLVWLKRKEFKLPQGGSRWLAAGALGLGLASLGTWFVLAWSGWNPGVNDYLSLTIFSFVCFIIAGAALFLGAENIRLLAFPTFFLLFMAPFPGIFLEHAEVFLQYASAEAAHGFLSLSGCPFFRQGLFFHLPNITIKVAEECSGIRSTLVLFIASLMAGYLFLRSPWKRALLAFAVVPLGILRNGFRIWTISMLCAHDTDMISSPLHLKGGPLFFILSLVPFFLLLLYLWGLERRSQRVSVGAKLIWP